MSPIRGAADGASPIRTFSGRHRSSAGSGRGTLIRPQPGDVAVVGGATVLLRAHAMAGVTTVRDLGDWEPHPGLPERPGLPQVVAAGPPLTTPGGHCHLL